MNTLTAMLSGPDLLEGAGLLGGGMILSLEQMLTKFKLNPKLGYGSKMIATKGA